MGEIMRNLSEKQRIALYGLSDKERLELANYLLTGNNIQKKSFSQKCDICKAHFRSNRAFETPICNNCDGRSSDYGDGI